MSSFPDAWVYHKRRTDLKKFFKQVHNSGIARINLYKKYPDSLKLVHLLPAVFTLGVSLLLLLTLLGLGLVLLAFYLLYSKTVPGCATGEMALLFLGFAAMLAAPLPYCSIPWWFAWIRQSEIAVYGLECCQLLLPLYN